jgi:hypothetical protein
MLNRSPVSPGIGEWHCFDRNGLAIDENGIRFKGRNGKRNSQGRDVIFDCV